MKLFGEAASLFTARVVLAARAKGIALPLAALPGGSMKSPEFIAISSIGKIPVLEDDGKYIAESQVIIEYLEETQGGRPIMPSTALERARCRTLCRIVDLYIMPAATGFYTNMDPTKRDSRAVAQATDDYQRTLGYFESFMGPGPFAMAESLTMADCALAPLMDVMNHTILPKFGLESPIDSMRVLGPWWSHVQSDAIVGTMLADYRVAFQEFLRARS